MVWYGMAWNGIAWHGMAVMARMVSTHGSSSSPGKYNRHYWKACHKQWNRMQSWQGRQCRSWHEMAWHAGRARHGMVSTAGKGWHGTEGMAGHCLEWQAGHWMAWQAGHVMAWHGMVGRAWHGRQGM